MTLPNFNSDEPIIIDGVKYLADELYTRNILIYGVQPTDFEGYHYVNVLALHPNRKSGAGGQAQSQYRYDDLADLDKFHQHQYPYFLPCTMVTASDRKGNQVQIIVHADFANVKEMQLVERVQNKKVSASVTPKQAT